MFMSIIRDWFLVGKLREFGLMFFIEVVFAIVNLMLGFRIIQIGPLHLKLWSISFMRLSQVRLFNCFWEIKGIWTHVLHRSCNYNCELDVRLLNHPN